MTVHERLKQLSHRASAFRHQLCLWWCALGHDGQYRAYLRTQLDRSLIKRRPQPELRTKLLVDQLVETGGPHRSEPVLCIGSRNIFEIEYFLKRGYSNVVGIDLFSEESRILVMDMHAMTFPNDRFAIVYACHSLEHAYNVRRVAREIIRVSRDGALVAIEVPVRYETTKADLVDFGNFDNLLAVFQPHVAKVLWSEELPPSSPRNECGTAVLRTVFSVRKKDETLPPGACMPREQGCSWSRSP